MASITKALVVGVVLAVFGVAIMLAGWPSVEVAPDDYNIFTDEVTEESGSWVAVGFGAILGGIGQFLISVAAIGYGTRLGAKAVAEEGY